MDLKEQEVYSTKDMQNFFGVSKDTWKKKKDSLLFHLSNYFEYEVEYDSVDYRKCNYHIIKQLHEYEPPLKKSVKRDLTYEKNIIKTIEISNLQTAKNVSRIIKTEPEILNFHHKDGTVYEYTRVNMRKMFGTKIGEFGTRGCILDKIWCRVITETNLIVPMSEEEIKNFYSIFSECREPDKEIIATLYSDYQSGTITKEELYKHTGELGLQAFITAQKLYKVMYGFTPQKVPIYCLAAYEDTDKETLAA